MRPDPHLAASPAGAELDRDLEEVVVVGGGVSGLAAAVALVQAGVRVTLLEARGVLGGRATSFRDPRTGEVFDNGQHALMGCYHATFALLDTIGARHGVVVQRRLTLPMVADDGRRVVLRCPDWPSPWHLLGGVLTWRDLSWSERARVLAVGPALLRARRAVREGEPDGLPCLADETVAAWLARHGQRDHLVQWLWEPLALAALNQDIGQAVAPPFVRVLGRLLDGDRSNASIALATRPLAELFANPARDHLERHGARVHVHALARVVINGGRVVAVDVRGRRRRVRTVIVATPWHTWPTLFTGDTAPLAALIASARETAASPIVTVFLEFDRQVIDAPVIGFPGQPVQWAFDISALDGRPRDPGSRVALVSSGATGMLRLSDEETARRARRVIDTASPLAARAILRTRRVVRESRATFSLSPGQPGRPATTTPVEGLYLASDWVDTGLPATIEGAVEAGHRAAAAVLEAGRP